LLDALLRRDFFFLPGDVCVMILFPLGTAFSLAPGASPLPPKRLAFAMQLFTSPTFSFFLSAAAEGMYRHSPFPRFPSPVPRSRGGLALFRQQGPFLFLALFLIASAPFKLVLVGSNRVAR